MKKYIAPEMTIQDFSNAIEAMEKNNKTES